MSLLRHISEDLRAAVLGLLQEAGCEANDYILRRAVGELGHNPSVDQMRTELAWLAEQGLVTIRRVGDFTVARLTSRGADVALGRADVPGVRRPEPDGIE